MSLPWLEPQCRRFDRNIEAGRLGHAPLIRGAAGSGKRALAAWLSRRLLCRSPTTPNPCGRCDACMRIESATHPDFFRLSILEEKKEIVVDQVREFIGALLLTPSLGSRRVGLIEPADALNDNAANALLKTLEEPAEEAWLILVVDRPEQLPATVRSRCQQVTISLPDRDSALDWLKTRHDGTDPARVEQALALADGAPLCADRWLADGELDRGLAVAALLEDLVAGKAVTYRVPEDWTAEPGATWLWLARWVRHWLGGMHDPLSQAMPTPKFGYSPERALQMETCWHQALEGQRMAGEPVRHDWLLLRWLHEWRRLADLA